MRCLIWFCLSPEIIFQAVYLNKYLFYSIFQCFPNCIFWIVREKMQIKKINRKWVPHELSETYREMREIYSKLNLKNYKQQKTCLQHTITIEETWISLYRPPEKDQARERLRKCEKSTSVTVSYRYEPKVMQIWSMDIKCIFYYEFLDEKEPL